LAKLVIIV